VKDWNEIKAWRKAQRAELIAAREAFPAAQRQAWSERISASLEAGIPVPAGAVVGYCWPHRSEFDARFVVRRWREHGATAALPEVVEKRGPLRFSRWWPGAPMRPGVYDIPVPDGTGVVEPDIAIVPMNGFDEQGYRLGYGGGYFDRTLAALGRRVIAIGVSFEALRVPTIHPQPHDIPMDIVVTEAGIHRAGGTSLVRLTPEECMAELKMLMRGRDLPRPRIPEPRDTGSYASPVCYAPEIAPDYFGAADAPGDKGPGTRD
jgi:5-formyltetrahydrofolate cyclo-ligase